MNFLESAKKRRAKKKRKKDLLNKMLDKYGDTDYSTKKNRRLIVDYNWLAGYVFAVEEFEEHFENLNSDLDMCFEDKQVIGKQSMTKAEILDLLKENFGRIRK